MKAYVRVKKGLALILLTLGLALGVGVVKVHAVIPQHTIYYNQLWEITEVDDGVWGFQIAIAFDAGSLTTLDINIPGSATNVQTHDGWDSQFTVMGTSGTVVSDDLDTWVPLNVDDVIHFDFEAPSIITAGVVYDADPDVATINYINILVLQTLASIPAGMLQWVINRATAIGLSYAIPVYFYDRLTLLQIEPYSSTLSDPGSPTAPANYRFMGWYTRTGEKFDFTTLEVKDVWIVTDDEGSRIALFASYVSTLLEDGELTPDQDASTVPAFLSGPMAMVGLDNENGYFLIFMIVAVILVIAMLAFLNDRVDNVVPFIMIALIVWTGAAIWLGILPLWGAAILIAIELGFTISGFSKGGATA